MAGVERVKRSHFVPKSYLARFATQKGQLWVYDKANDKCYQSSITTTGAVGGFYDLPDWAQSGPGQSQKAESDFSQDEGRWKLAIDQLVARAERGHAQPIRLEDKPGLAHLILMQMVRTPLHRETVRQMISGTNGVVNAISAKYDARPPDGYPIRMNEELLQVGHIDAMYDTAQIVHNSVLLLQHIWVLLKNTSGKPFYTSDSPVTMRGHLGYIGIAEEGIEIAFPLNPNYMLVLLDRKYHRQALPFDNRLKEIDPAIVTYYHYHQATYCQRYVYSPDDDFADARAACEMFPHTRDARMARVSVRSPLLE